MGANDNGFLDYAGLSKVISLINTKIDSVLTNLESLPIGSIIMWSGETIPSGWAICDGQNGTPDLRGRFVMGADAEHTLGETGGSASHTLSVDELPAHKHATSGISVTEDGSGGSLFSGGEDSIAPSSNTETGETGGGTSFNILPPYYALAYIMKLSA